MKNVVWVSSAFALTLVILFFAHGCKELEEAFENEGGSSSSSSGALGRGRKRAAPVDSKPAEKASSDGSCSSATASVSCGDGNCCQTGTKCCPNSVCAEDCSVTCAGGDTPVDCLDGTCCAKECCADGSCDDCKAAPATSERDGGDGG